MCWFVPGEKRGLDRSVKDIKKKERIEMKNMRVMAVIAVAGMTSVASADSLFTVDLSVIDQVTITATSGVSSANATASDYRGVYLADFFGDSTGNLLSLLTGYGDLTSAGTTSDLSPELFRDVSGVETGVNLWEMTGGADHNFTAGALAFTGSATWNVSSIGYAEMLLSVGGGNVYAGADSIDDIGGAGVTLIGTWGTVIPAPSSMALLGLGGLVAGRRRR